MSSDLYSKYGYYRTIESYIKEWRAHNFVNSIIPFGTIGKKP